MSVNINKLPFFPILLRAIALSILSGNEMLTRKRWGHKLSSEAISRQALSPGFNPQNQANKQTKIPVQRATETSAKCILSLGTLTVLEKDELFSTATYFSLPSSLLLSLLPSFPPFDAKV